MKLDRKMEQALNDQINAELHSAYIYLAMAAHFEGEAWPGMAKWMKKQAEEEMEHAMKIYRYVFERGGQVELTKLDDPTASWTNPLGVFKAALKHEQYISERILKLADMAEMQKDRATSNFLIWFVNEQVEEEDSMGTMLQIVQQAGEKNLLMVEAYMTHGE